MTPLKHTYCIWIASAPFCWLYGTRWCRLSAAPAVSVAANPSRSQTLRFGLRAVQCIRGENAASRRISLSKSVLNICWSLISTISNLTFLPCPTILEDDIDLILKSCRRLVGSFIYLLWESGTGLDRMSDNRDLEFLLVSLISGCVCILAFKDQCRTFCHGPFLPLGGLDKGTNFSQLWRAFPLKEFPTRKILEHQSCINQKLSNASSAKNPCSPSFTTPGFESEAGIGQRRTKQRTPNGKGFCNGWGCKYVHHKSHQCDNIHLILDAAEQAILLLSRYEPLLRRVSSGGNGSSRLWMIKLLNMRKVEAATFQGQLYLWATISRFSHTNEYVVKENNRPLSRRGMAPSAWVLRLSIGPSTPPSLEDLDTKCPYEFRPTVSNHRPLDWIGTPTRKSWEFGPKHLLWKKKRV